MTLLKIKKLHPDAVVPKRMTTHSAGLDLVAIEDATVPPDKSEVIRSENYRILGTGLSMEIPPGYEIQIRPRSGLAAKHQVTLLNSPGTIDSDYRGEIKVLLINHGFRPFLVKKGDRIAQAVLCAVEDVDILEVEELTETGRGSGGFGSTGK